MAITKKFSAVEPGAEWWWLFDLSPILAVADTIDEATVTVSGGYTVSGAAQIGTVALDARGQPVFTEDADGQVVRQEFVAGATVGNGYVVTVSIVAGSGAEPSVSFYAPIAKRS